MTLQIEGTNDSSCLSKYSAANSGYFKDDFLCNFVKKCSRRAPLIHLGYSVRAQIINKLLENLFLSFNELIQIVSLGAGFDTLFFKFKVEFPNIKFTYYELDLPRVVKTKINCIQKTVGLRKVIGEYSDSSDGIISDQYKLLAVDLRDIKAVEKLLQDYNLDKNCLTLFLSECAITYLEEDRSSDLIRLASGFSHASFLTYEQIHPDDGFGLVMTRHFASLQSPLLSVASFPSLALQTQRYTDLGWSHCTSTSALEAYNTLVSDTERKRVLRLEPFDEWEEFYLKCCHYAVIVASNGKLANWAKKYLGGGPSLRIGISERKELSWSLEELEGVSLYGHSVAWWRTDGGDDHLIVAGGWGEKDGGAHSRLKQLTWLRRDKERWIVDRQTAAGDTGAMFSTWTKISSDKNQYVVYGGRTSPSRVVWPEPVVATVSSTNPVTWQQLVTSQNASFSPPPPPRYRHSAVVARRHGVKTFVVFGGRTADLLLLGDTWTVPLDDSAREVSFHTSSNQPCARHSHSAAVRRRDSGSDEVWISGGFSSAGPEADLWCLKLASGQWQEWPVNLLPRAGHSSSILGIKLLLVGGVNDLDSCQPGVAVVDLETVTCVEYRLPGMSPGHSLMLINHCHVISEDGRTLWTLGGGGNCFSFGTFFNRHSAAIQLAQFGL